MSEKIVYVARAVGGAVVIRMPKHTLGQEYTETEGKDGVIYLRPVQIVVDPGNEYDAMGEQL